jgi:hypothetical protein
MEKLSIKFIKGIQENKNETTSTGMADSIKFPKHRI